MKTNDKTLADVQPGGRVRLGDEAERARFEAWAREEPRYFNIARSGADYYYPTVQDAWIAWQAALSAQPSPGATALGLPIVVDPTVPPDTFEVRQPSPGGQGDALLESLVARWRNHAEEIGGSDNLLCQKIANCTMRHAAELQAVLAARQPVASNQVVENVEQLGVDGQPVGQEPVYGPSYREGFSEGKALGRCQRYRDVDAIVFNAMKSIADIAMLHDPLMAEKHIGFLDGWFYSARHEPPAQAVDMGAMPDGWRLSKKATCYQLSHGNDIIGNLVGPDAEENAAIIARVLDSQAVGK